MKNTILFAERLKELRLEAAKTQKDVAKDLNISQSTVAKWENKDQQPSLEMLVQLSYYFNVSPNYLLGVDDI